MFPLAKAYGEGIPDQYVFLSCLSHTLKYTWINTAVCWSVTFDVETKVS